MRNPFFHWMLGAWLAFPIILVIGTPISPFTWAWAIGLTVAWIVGEFVWHEIP